MAFQIHRHDADEAALARTATDAAAPSRCARWPNRSPRIALRKACETVGLRSPAQASHSVGRNLGDRAVHLDRNRIRRCRSLRPLSPVRTSRRPRPRRRPAASRPRPRCGHACPASPNTATIKSEAPLTTCGMSVNSGVQLTKPPSRRQRFTRSRSPPARHLELRQDVERAELRRVLAFGDGDPAAELADEWRRSPFHTQICPEMTAIAPDTVNGT